MFWGEDTTYNDIRKKSLEQWVGEMGSFKRYEINYDSL